MAWIKVDDQMVDHPKIEPLSADAFRWIHRGLSYANRFLTNGVLPAVFIARVPTTYLEELITVRDGQKNPVWHRGENGTYRIHDFKDYQPTKAEVERDRRRNRARQAKWRKGHAQEKRNVKHNGVTNRVTNSAPSRPGPAPSNKRSPLPPAGAGGRARQAKRLPRAVLLGAHVSQRKKAS